MEKRNYRCKNKSCGISFSSETLSNCPVCGSEDVSRDTKTKKVIFFLILVLVTVGGLFVLFNPFQESSLVNSNQEPSKEISCDSISQKYNLQKIDYLDSKKKQIAVVVDGVDSTDKIFYSIDSGKTKSTSNSFTVSADDSIISVMIIIDTSTNCNKYFEAVENEYYENKSSCDEKKELIKSLNSNFKKFISDPKSNINLKQKIKSIAKKIGFSTTLFDVTIDDQSNKYTMEKLLNKISADARGSSRRRKKYEMVSDFEINFSTDGNECKFDDAKVRIKKI